MKTCAVLERETLDRTERFVRDVLSIDLKQDVTQKTVKEVALKVLKAIPGVPLKPIEG